jgi:hypothetical protein
MWANATLQRQSQVVSIGIDTFRPVVNFVFGKAIGTFQSTGFIPDIVACAEWAFVVGHHDIR